MPMRKGRFTEEQIAHTLRQAKTGKPVTEVCRAIRVNEQTYYRWTKQYGGVATHEIRRLRLLEEDNRRLKQLVADLSLDKLRSGTEFFFLATLMSSSVQLQGGREVCVEKGELATQFLGSGGMRGGVITAGSAISAS
jgi:putative transposase